MNEDADEAAGMFIRLLMYQYERCFPEKRQRMRNDNKPWMTARILNLMDRRRKAYDNGRIIQWRELYFKVKDEVKKMKSETAKSIERNQLNSRKFSKQLQCVFGKNKKKTQCPLLISP